MLDYAEQFPQTCEVQEHQAKASLSSVIVCLHLMVLGPGCNTKEVSNTPWCCAVGCMLVTNCLEDNCTIPRKRDFGRCTECALDGVLECLGLHFAYLGVTNRIFPCKFKSSNRDNITSSKLTHHPAAELERAPFARLVHLAGRHQAQHCINTALCMLQVSSPWICSIF